MVYRIQHIARDVRIAIDENKTSEQLIADEDIDTLSLDEIVQSKVQDAARQVLSTASVELLDTGAPFGDSVYWRGDGSGWILLPDDFMRLIVFRMSDWERPVYSAIGSGDPEYARQFSRYKGIRGNPQKPVVAIVRRAEGLALELYSCRDESATVDQATYLPLPRVDREGGIDLPARCYRSVVYKCASLALSTLGQNELSSTMLELSKQLLV